MMRAAAGWVFTALFWIVLWTLQVLALRRLPASLVQSWTRFWGRGTLRILGIRLRLVGQSTVEDRAARVVVFNHQSALDILWMAAVVAPAALTIGKRELIYIPFINMGWWVHRFVRIDRSRPHAALAGLAGVSAEIVKNSRTLIVAPEGTRTRDGSIGPFKRGAFRFAVDSGAPICPLVVSGAFDCLPRNKFLPRRGEIVLRFLPPIATAGLGEKGLDDLSARVHKAMSDALAADKA